MMIKNKKIYILILALSLACTGTYSSYSYFTSQSVEGNNKISIGELEPEEGLQEIVTADIRGDTLELKFSKRLFYPTENITEGITGDKYILDNTEVTIKDTSIYIKKLSGKWILPTKKNTKNLPKIALENFEDRFGKKMKSQDIYLYQNQNFISNGKLDYVIADKGSKTDAEILSSAVAGVDTITGVNANVELVFNNSKEVKGIFMNAENTILEKNTRGSVSIKSMVNITGRFKLKIKDSEGLNIEEIFIAIKGETHQELMAKVTSQILDKFNTEKYILTFKENNTRFDITSKLSINTGLNVEIEILQ